MTTATWYAMKRNGMKQATIREHVGGGAAICKMADGTTDAQASLVTAAPDLLAAAKLAFSALNGSSSWTDEYAKAFAALGAAIQKAERP